MRVALLHAHAFQILLSQFNPVMVHYIFLIDIQSQGNPQIYCKHTFLLGIAGNLWHL